MLIVWLVLALDGLALDCGACGHFSVRSRSASLHAVHRLSFGLSYVLRVPFSFMGPRVAVAVLVSLVFVVYLACRSLALEVLAATTEGAPARETSITQPSTYQPFAHGLFVAIYAFRIAYGFALTFESVW